MRAHLHDGGGGPLEVVEGERFIHSRCHRGELREVAACSIGLTAGTSTFSSPVTCTLSQVVLLAKLNGCARYYHNVPKSEYVTNDALDFFSFHFYASHLLFRKKTC